MSGQAQSPSPVPARDLLNLDPVPALIARTRIELAGSFDPKKPMRISRAPGRLDVMGGIADYTGSLVCEATLDRAAALVLQERDDRELQIFSFNLYDENKPFTFRMPLDNLARAGADELRREFDAPGRRWAGYIAGCLYLLHEQKFVDLNDPKIKGLNIALYSTVPLGAGVSSSAAIEVATMMNLVEHFNIARHDGTEARRHGGRVIDPMKLSAMCQAVENRIVGAPCGIMDQVSSCYGQADSLLRMVCQPHELQPSLALPEGIRVLGINSNVKHSVGGGMYGRTRCAAFMAQRIILEAIRAMAASSGKTLERDPMNGYLANLDPDDYKSLFRALLPEYMKGQEFLDAFGGTIDTATAVEPDFNYHIQHAADHHVLEARRVKYFVEFLERASGVTTEQRKFTLDKAGHLMYASHLSYTMDAMLGADECDLLVKLVREREEAGLYGAKITGGGSGGTVAILAEAGQGADNAVAEIMDLYEKQSGRKPEAFLGTSPGAWHVGTSVGV